MIDADVDAHFHLSEWRMKYKEGGLTGGAVSLDKLFKVWFYLHLFILLSVRALSLYSSTRVRLGFYCHACLARGLGIFAKLQSLITKMCPHARVQRRRSIWRWSRRCCAQMLCRQNSIRSLSLTTLPSLQIPGFVKVDRLVCGACNDFKIIVKLKAPNFDVSE